MRYFDRAELARRYHAYRPRVHGQVVREVAASRPPRPLHAVLDVACGTAHSTSALAGLAPVVCACDASEAMLSEARQEASSAHFVRAQAEALPFPPGSFDLVTVSMAFHWFDQRRFIEETSRVLAAGGELWAYNLVFPGVVVGDDAFSRWHREEYLVRYPVPARHPKTLAGLLATEGPSLEFVAERKVAYEVDFTSSELRQYLTTQSNIEAALRGGAALRDVDAWLDEELAPFFGEATSRRFAYIGRVEIAAAA